MLKIKKNNNFFPLIKLHNILSKLPQGTFRPNITSLAPILNEQQAGYQNLTLELNTKFDAVANRKIVCMSRIQDFAKTRQKLVSIVQNLHLMFIGKFSIEQVLARYI